MSASSATLGVRNANLLARHRSLSVGVSRSSRPGFGTPLARRGLLSFTSSPSLSSVYLISVLLLVRVSGLLDGIFFVLEVRFHPTLPSMGADVVLTSRHSVKLGELLLDSNRSVGHATDAREGSMIRFRGSSFSFYLSLISKSRIVSHPKTDISTNGCTLLTCEGH